jgi:hypothetical protein
VVVLDLVEFVGEGDKPAAREHLAFAIDRVKAGGAEVFAQVDPDLLYADLKACVWPALSGIIIAKLESPRQVVEGQDLLASITHMAGYGRDGGYRRQTGSSGPPGFSRAGRRFLRHGGHGSGDRRPNGPSYSHGGPE